MCMFKNRQQLFQQTWDIWGHERCFPDAWGAQVHPTQIPHHLWLYIDQGKARDSKCDVAQVLGGTWGLFEALEGRELCLGGHWCGPPA